MPSRKKIINEFFGKIEIRRLCQALGGHYSYSDKNKPIQDPIVDIKKELRAKIISSNRLNIVEYYDGIHFLFKYYIYYDEEQRHFHHGEYIYILDVSFDNFHEFLKNLLPLLSNLTSLSYKSIKPIDLNSFHPPTNLKHIKLGPAGNDNFFFEECKNQIDISYVGLPYKKNPKLSVCYPNNVKSINILIDAAVIDNENIFLFWVQCLSPPIKILINGENYQNEYVNYLFPFLE